MTPNPPIKGHELLFEGAAYLAAGWSRPWSPYPLDAHGRSHYGGCRCGAVPDGFPDVSSRAMKRWHREHKAAIRSLDTKESAGS